MQIEVESLKELEPGKTYAVQMKCAVNIDEAIAYSRSLCEIGSQHGMKFILFNEKLRLIDAPKEVVDAGGK